MSLRKRKEVQEMPRSCGLALLVLLLTGSLFGDDQGLWREYGLTHTETLHQRNSTVTAYRMKDATGALAAWEWLRSAKARSCDLASFCTKQGDKVTIFNANYVLVFEGGNPRKSDVDAVISSLPDRHESTLPPILSFLPRDDLVPQSARYLLGPGSVDAFAPDMKGMALGFDQGAEGQIATYKAANGQRVRLVVMEYPTPDMARAHAASASKLLGPFVKRSGSLVAVVLSPASQQQADALLGKVQYEAKVVWNDEPATNQIKPLYEILWSIIYISCLLAALCTLAGFFYAGMRIYRRRYGNLEDEESMTALHLSGD